MSLIDIKTDSVIMFFVAIAFIVAIYTGMVVGLAWLLRYITLEVFEKEIELWPSIAITVVVVVVL